MTELAIPYDLNPMERKNRRRFMERFNDDILRLNTSFYLLDERLGQFEKNWQGQHAVLFISQNYSVLHNSLQLLSTGYELESMMLIRPAAERVILTLYFYEFPADLDTYKKEDGPRKFYASLRTKGYKNYLEGALDRIMAEGKLFTNTFKDQWAKELFVSLVDEPSKLLHANEFPATVASVRGHRLIRGSHFRIRSSRIVLSKIRQAALWSILALFETQQMQMAFWEDLTIRHEVKELYGIDKIAELESELQEFSLSD